MKKISLRLRLTLFIILLLTGVCVVMTLFSLYNANNVFVMPYISTILSESPNAFAPNVGYDVPATTVTESMSSASVEVNTVAAITQSSMDFNALSLFTMVAVTCGGGLLTYFLLGRALKPLHNLSGQISAITENELSQTIGQTDSHDEIGSLAHSFNTMLTRLDKAFSDQKRFSSDAAHELKTPLAAIKTNIDVLQLESDPTTAEYKQTVNVVKKQTDRMIRLVDDLFTISSQRNYDFNDTLDIDSMFNDIMVQLSPRIIEKDIAVNLKSCGYATTANSVMLMRAFSNLVENAVKYNVTGGSIDIDVRADEKNFTFTIADTGVGIPEEKLAHIFDPFYRVDDSRSRKIGGAGLGLAIAKDIFERHGGTISVAPGKENGVVFTVTLPRLSAE